MKQNHKHHVCCGKRIKARVIDGKLVEQEHKCQDSADVRGVDWEKVKERV